MNYSEHHNQIHAEVKGSTFTLDFDLRDSRLAIFNTDNDSQESVSFIVNLNQLTEEQKADVANALVQIAAMLLKPKKSN